MPRTQYKDRSIINQTQKKADKNNICSAEMASFSTLFAAVFISAIAFQSCLVHGNFYNDMYFNWGAKHSYIYNNGDDISLLLDKSAGNELPDFHVYCNPYF